jgi:DNA-binding NarL/FixJ family response regulator
MVKMKREIIIERTNGAALNNSHAKPRLCIWLVDDDVACSELLTWLLNEQPRVNCPRSFSSAISLLAALRQEAPPDVILMDVHMPAMNGIEAIRPVRNLAPATLVLMLTTFFDQGLKQEALASGAADFLLKRNPPAQIIAAIRAASTRLSSP